MHPDQQDIYYGVRGERYGPVTPDRIREMVEAGQLTVDDFLWDEERDDWVPIGDYPQLRELAATTTPQRDAAFEGDAWSGGGPAAPGAGHGFAPAADRPYAGFWLRFLAYMIDSIVLFVPVAVWMFVAVALSPLDWEALAATESTWDPLSNSQQDEAVSIFYLWAYGGSFVIQWLYHALLESSPWQATLGKRAVGVYVTDGGGQRLSFGRATGRYFGKILSSIPFNLGFLMVAFTDRKQGLHDKLAETYVVRNRT